MGNQGSAPIQAKPAAKPNRDGRTFVVMGSDAFYKVWFTANDGSEGSAQGAAHEQLIALVQQQTGGDPFQCQQVLAGGGAKPDGSIMWKSGICNLGPLKARAAANNIPLEMARDLEAQMPRMTCVNEEIQKIIKGNWESSATKLCEQMLSSRAESEISNRLSKKARRGDFSSIEEPFAAVEKALSENTCEQAFFMYDPRIARATTVLTPERLMKIVNSMPRGCKVTWVRFTGQRDLVANEAGLRALDAFVLKAPKLTEIEIPNYGLADNYFERINARIAPRTVMVATSKSRIPADAFSSENDEFEG